MANILLLNGPNLNLLGSREVSHYSATSLSQIECKLQAKAEQQNHVLISFQSNREYELIETIQHAPGHPYHFILFNPASFTHTSIALRDALLAVAIPFIEIHLSNVYTREAFRQHSYFSDVAAGVITGFGPLSYELALQAAITLLEK